MLQYEAVSFIFLLARNKQWYDVCTYFDMMLVAYVDSSECYDMWAYHKTKMLWHEHTHCYDMIAHHVTIGGFLSCFVTCLSITNIGMMCVHILVWHWWLIMNVMKCGHIPKQKCYYVCTHIVMIFLIIVLQFEFKKVCIW